MSAKVTIDVKKKEVTIVLPLLDTPRTSASGATCSYAETRNEATDVVHEGKAIKVTAQVYFKPPKA